MIFEISLTCTLLVATGLLLKAFQTLGNNTTSFNPDGVSSVVLLSSDPNLSGQISTLRDSANSLRHGGHSRDLGRSNADSGPVFPFQHHCRATSDPVSSSAHQAGALISVISSGYTRTMQTPMVGGRGFDDSDHKERKLFVS